MTLLEPDVTLTDYGIALECGALAWLVCRREGSDGWFTWFFLATGTAALLGGTVHGFLSDKQSLWYVAAWDGTLLAIGLAALSGWAVGANMLFSPGPAARIVRAAATVYLFYTVVVIFVRNEFVVAILHYLPAAIFMLSAFVMAYRRSQRQVCLVGALGMILTFVAAGVQQAGIGLHPRYFNHNALYHLIQAVALVLIYRVARSAVDDGVIFRPRARPSG
jgi:hypothetical protein